MHFKPIYSKYTIHLSAISRFPPKLTRVSSKYPLTSSPISLARRNDCSGRAEFLGKQMKPQFEGQQIQHHSGLGYRPEYASMGFQNRPAPERLTIRPGDIFSFGHNHTQPRPNRITIEPLVKRRQRLQDRLHYKTLSRADLSQSGPPVGPAVLAIQRN